jgi:hypothetical protein
MTKKFISLLLFIGTSTLISGTCSQVEDNPEIRIVNSEDIPRPFTNNIYFIYGSALDSSEQYIINNLLENDFKIRNIWIPDSYGDCMPPYIKEMILEIEQPDSRIYSYGFTSDSTHLSFYCITGWKNYNFRN